MIHNARRRQGASSARRSGASTEHRVDARTERWREHRIMVREQFVDAAFAALDRYGPDVSMGDIAKQAGAAKPKLYRHFQDKTDLYNAIVDRVQAILWDRVIVGVDLVGATAAELIRRVAGEYALVVNDHPNVFRFMVHSHFTQQAQESERALQSARQSARRAAELFAALVDDPELDAAAAELIVYSIFGAIGSATDWWLGANRSSGNPMTSDAFVDYLVAIITGVVLSATGLRGIVVDPDRPLSSLLSDTAPASPSPETDRKSR